MKLFQVNIRKLHRILDKAQWEIYLTKSSSTNCEEHKDWKACWQKYHDEKLISYIYIDVKEQRVRDFIDQLPDDQHKLGKYVEIGENYDVSKSNTQAFKMLNTDAGANSIDTVTTFKGKNKLGTYYGFSHKFGQCPAKEAVCKICQKSDHFGKVCKANMEKQNKIMTGQIISLLDIQEIRKPPLSICWQMTVKS